MTDYYEETREALRQARTAKNAERQGTNGDEPPWPDSFGDYFDDQAGANEQAENGPREKSKRRFTLRRFGAITVGSDLVYLVKGIIPRAGLIVIWGPPKCGKSFWTFDVAMHPALGRDYRGRRVQQGAVVYLALEGGKGFERRVEAFRRHHSVTDAPFFLITDRTNLVTDHAALVEAIRKELGPDTPVLVVIDTLNRSLAGSESKDEDMAKYIHAADAIREAFGCAVAIVHHCGVDGSRPRGHTSLGGAVDAQLAVKRDAANNIVVEVEWMKDGPEGDEIVSRLEPIEVGTDADGAPIDSCVIVPVDGPAVRPASNRKLSDRQRLGLDALADCACDLGQAPPATWGLPAGLRAVKLDEWRDELYRRGVIDRDAKNPREDLRRVRSSLQARNLIGVRDDWVWKAERETN
jgi:hypothetical protein